MAEVLYIDDDPEFRTIYSEVLERAGFGVEAVPTAEAGLERLRERAADVVLLDLSLPPGSMSGIGFLEELRIRHVGVPVVVFTGYGDVVDHRGLQQLGATHVLTKGRDLSNELVAVLRRLAAARGAA